jgi:hypothetical protein
MRYSLAYKISPIHLESHQGRKHVTGKSVGCWGKERSLPRFAIGDHSETQGPPGLRAYTMARAVTTPTALGQALLSGTREGLEAATA